MRARPLVGHIAPDGSPESNGVIECFLGSLKCEHLSRLETGDVVALAAEIVAFRLISNTVRPHEALGFERPTDAAC